MPASTDETRKLVAAPENSYQELVSTTASDSFERNSIFTADFASKVRTDQLMHLFLCEELFQKLVFTSGNMFERLLMAPQRRKMDHSVGECTHLPTARLQQVGKAADKLKRKRLWNKYCGLVQGEL